MGGANVSAACIYNNTTPYTGGINTDANGDLFVPNPSNIMSYSRKYCCNFFSVGQYARIYSAYTTNRNYFTCSTFNANFTATPTSSCTAPVTVNFMSTSVGATSWQWDVDGDNIVDYTTENPSHTYITTGAYDVRLTISNGSETIFKTKTTYINVSSSYNVPYTEDFETFTSASNATGYNNGWEGSPRNTTFAFRWNANNGSTPSDSVTGPLVDNTLGTAAGHYIFTEATGYTTGNVAEFISPCINLNVANPQLSFAYHKFANAAGQMGNLHVDIFAGGVWSNDITPVIYGAQNASQASAWSTRTVDLTTYAGQTVRFRFRGIRGGGAAGDMAIDDINIIDILTTPFISFVADSSVQAEAATTGTVDCRGYVDLNIPLQITHSPTGNAFVAFNTAGSANSAYDYQILTPTVMFPNGSTANQNLQIRVIDDAAEEVAENLVLTYTIYGGSDAVAGTSNQSHTLTINDNDMLPSDFVGNANVATGLVSTQLYFGPNETVYFYDGSNNVMAMLENVTAHDYGCTTVQLDRTGTGSVAYDDANALYYVANKTYLITPTSNNFGQYNVTLYYTSAEIAGWETATSNIRANLNIRKTGGASANITPVTPTGNGATNYNGLATNRVVYDGTEFAITSTFYSGFSGFVIGQRPSSTIILYAELAELRGQKITTQHNQLTWITESEENNSHFEVERSLDGVFFEKIGKVKSLGNSSTTQNYLFDDKSATTRDLCYYRLRQVDLSGKAIYSNTISIKGREWNVRNIDVFPNPSTGVFNVLFETKNMLTIPIQIYNSIGQLVYTTSIDAEKGKNNKTIDLSEFVAGMYLLQIQYNDTEYRRTIIKK